MMRCGRGWRFGPCGAFIVVRMWCGESSSLNATVRLGRVLRHLDDRSVILSIFPIGRIAPCQAGLGFGERRSNHGGGCCMLFGGS